MIMSKKKKGSRTRLETENVVHRDCKAAVIVGGKLQPWREGKIIRYTTNQIYRKELRLMQRRCLEHINSRTW